MKALTLALLLAFGSRPALAQHYLTAGGGFSIMQLQSSDFDRFQLTYNIVNSESGQTSMLQGFDLGIGLGGEVSYRHLGKWSKALTAGYQESKTSDFASYLDDTTRRFTLRIRQYYLQPGFGYTDKDLFVDGIVTIFLRRDLQVDSRLVGNSSANPLSGVYKSNVALTLDAGITVGYVSGPLMFILKTTYPIRKSGEREILHDPAPAKVADNRSAFPDDYINFVDGLPYKGIASDIDGLKVMMTLNYALNLSKQPR